jgi:hypothetical protein
MKIRPVGANLFAADGQTDRHEVRSCFSKFCERAKKICRTSDTNQLH